MDSHDTKFVPHWKTENLHDASTQIVDRYLTKSTGVTNLTSATTPLTKVFDVGSLSGFSVGQWFEIQDGNGYHFDKIKATGPNQVTGYISGGRSFGSGAIVRGLVRDLGTESTGANFSVRTVADQSEVVLSRIIMSIRTASAPSLDDFGDIAALVNGLTIRHLRANGEVNNIFNFRTNEDIQSMCFDLSSFQNGTGPSADVEGVLARLSFDGESKHGAPVVLSSGDELQAVVSENLTGLVGFTITAQGHTGA